MKFPFNGNQYYINDYLSTQLHTIAYNLPKDWDMVLLVTGDRSVRVGKSVLAQTVAAYLSHTLNALKHKTNFDITDIYFDGKEMIDAALKKPRFAINLYDEGRESLAATKAMSIFQQQLVDFFTECGQLNQIFIIVAPDFFELKEYVSVARAEILLNVYRRETAIEKDIFGTGQKLPLVRFDRGHFEFFNKRAKQILFDKARSTRRKSYGLVKANFLGDFTNQYTVDEDEYRKKKRDSLARFHERHKEKKIDKNLHRNNYIITRKLEGASSTEIIAEVERFFKLTMGKTTINNIFNKYKANTKETRTIAAPQPHYINNMKKTRTIAGLEL